MEDRKRSLEDTEGETQAKRLVPERKPLDLLSEDGPLTQQDVVYFKKEAIWRQMRFYKLQAAELAAEVSKHERRFQAFIAVHLLLESWYRQVVAISKHESPPPLDLAADSAEIDAVLDERRQLLAKLLQPLASASDEGMERVLDAVKLAADRDAAIKLQEAAQQEVETLRAHIQNLQKEKDRRESATLKRILENSRITSNEPEPRGNGSQANGSAQEETKKAEAQTTAEKEAFEKLTVEHAEMKAAFSSLQSQLDEITQKLAETEKSGSDLELRLASLSEDDLNKNERYASVVSQNKFLAENLAQSERLKDDLVQRIRELESREGNLIALVNKELEEENTRLKESLSKSENDLVRIRAARDELLGKQAILKLEMENKKTNEELNKLNQMLSRRLGELEKTRQDERNMQQDAALEKLEKGELVKRLQILGEEVKEVEQAFQDTRAVALEKLKDLVDHESLVKKLTIEKNKADQKYFASMRLKDSLVAENKILKTQTAKSQELVAKFNDLEKTYLGKIDVLTKSINDYRVIKENALHENVKLQEALKQMTKGRETASKEKAALKSDLETVRREKNELFDELKSKRLNESKLEARLKSTESLLQKYRLNNTSLILQEDQKQLEALRSITKCSVCSKNWKNTVITACGHVFCEACVQDRLAARLRRCPTCNKGFASNDLLTIHL